MKQLILLSLSAALFACPGFAQTQKAQPANEVTTADVNKMEVQGIPIVVYVKGQTEQMTKDLNLTTAQQNDVTKLNTVVAVKRSNIEHMTDAKQIKDAKAALTKYSGEEYKKLLNPGQYAKWEKMNKI
jgi:NCAIR mutase (PurE)-related protein